MPRKGPREFVLVIGDEVAPKEPATKGKLVAAGK